MVIIAFHTLAITKILTQVLFLTTAPPNLLRYINLIYSTARMWHRDAWLIFRITEFSLVLYNGRLLLELNEHLKKRLSEKNYAYFIFKRRHQILYENILRVF